MLIKGHVKARSSNVKTSKLGENYTLRKISNTREIVIIVVLERLILIKIIMTCFG